MIVFDASAIIALLLGEPASGDVADLLRSRLRGRSIAAVGLAEVIDHLVRVAGRPIDTVEERIDLLIIGGLTVEPVTEPIGRRAGEVRAERYHRAQNPLSLADCVALATATVHGASLATSDRAMARTAMALAIEVIALPNSKGVQP